MTDQDKIAFANAVLNLIPNHLQGTTGTTPMQMVGVLRIAQGVKGFKTSEPGTPVFRQGDRLVLVMETLDGRSSANIPYYPETLAPIVDFDKDALQ